MDSEYIENLIEKFMIIVDGYLVPEVEPDGYPAVYSYGYENIEHELRNIITKVVLHTQLDGVGEP